MGQRLDRLVADVTRTFIEKGKPQKGEAFAQRVGAALQQRRGQPAAGERK